MTDSADARPALRIGDAERDAMMSALREHYAQGRLTLDELEERLDRTLAARTVEDLARIDADLPVLPGHPRRRTPAASAPEGRNGWHGHPWPAPPWAWPHHPHVHRHRPPVFAFVLLLLLVLTVMGVGGWGVVFLMIGIWKVGLFHRLLHRHGPPSLPRRHRPYA